jgi:hypothetical protein
VSRAAAQALKRFFGTDTVSFSDCSTTLPAGSHCGEASQVNRSFASFSQAADENALSRILVGFHFRDAVTAGIKHGREIADHTLNIYLRPIHGAHQQHCVAQAEPLYLQGLTILEESLGPEHPEVTYGLKRLAKLCSRMQFIVARSLWLGPSNSTVERV